MHPDGLSLDLSDCCDAESAPFAPAIEVLNRLIQCVAPAVERDGPTLAKPLLEPLWTVAFVLRLQGAISASDHAHAALKLIRRGFIPNKRCAELLTAHLLESREHAVMTQTALAAGGVQ